MKTHLQAYLAACAHRAVLRERPRVIVVAGSVGKSSTKEAIGVALGAGEAGLGVRVSAQNYNNQLGVPLTIFDRPAPGRSIAAWLSLLLRATLLRFGVQKIGATTLVLEYGTDRPGDLQELIAIAQPDVSVLTAIGAEHTEFFGSVDNVATEELTLIRSLGKTGIAVLNADDARVIEGKGMTEASIVTFGEDQGANVRLVSSRIVIDPEEAHANGLEVHIVTLGLAAHLRLRGVFGKPQALAATAALAVVLALDVDFHEAAERLKGFTGMPGRTRLIAGIKHTMLLDDSYNSSPLAALSAVRDLATYPVPEGAKRIAAMGDMLEMGPLANETHAQLGQEIAKAGIDMLVACGTLAHVIADAAKQAGMPEDRVFTFAKSSEAGIFIQGKLKQGDAVLIKGSQGARMEKITRELMADPLRADILLVRQSEKWLAT